MQVVQGFEAQDLLDAGGGPLVAYAPRLLSVLPLCAWCVACKYGSICDFKGVFRGFLLFRVGLCCLGALRGFCTRVELGGFMACGVFASVFLLLSLCLLSFYALRLSSGALSLLSSACPLAFLVVVSFSLSDVCAKKKGREGLSLASSLVVLCVFRFLYSY